MTGATTDDDLRIEHLDRPHPNLLAYKLLFALLFGPAFPIVAVAGWVRYRTLRYRFDDEGVSMSWGILFRRDISLTYARLQDIHLESNAVERWLGLGRVQLQTASGSARAEMVIEGLQEYEQIRDYLYTRMRGARGLSRTRVPASPVASATSGELAEVAGALRETAAELAALRRLLAERGGSRPDGGEGGA
jgi:uncharacterized membrane protein YdbT with pleckstrin-like domain